MRKRRGVNPWIVMGVNALNWPSARLRDCQRAILAASPYATTPIDTELRSSRISKMVRSDSPTSAEEFERLVTAASVNQQQQQLLLPSNHHVLAPEVPSNHGLMSVSLNSNPANSFNGSNKRIRID